MIRMGGVPIIPTSSLMRSIPNPGFRGNDAPRHARRAQHPLTYARGNIASSYSQSQASFQQLALKRLSVKAART